MTFWDNKYKNFEHVKVQNHEENLKNKENDIK